MRHFGETEQYLAACYSPEGDGIIYTPLKSDACQYLTAEKAIAVAQELKKHQGYDVYIAVTGDEQ